MTNGARSNANARQTSDHAVQSGSVRVLLYSHDSWGLGHLRRSLAIAGALVRRIPDCDVLIVTGSPCATQFDLPARCDVLKLPAVGKDAEGRYVSRHLTGHLSKTIQLRRTLITQAYHAFDPHLIVVDHQLTGLMDEAFDMLRAARRDGKILVYGMRDVLDASHAVERDWSRPNHHWALHQAFDRICVYGDPIVFDPRTQYPLLAPVTDKIEFSGYIVAPQDARRRRALPSLRPGVLVTTGGGEDGGRLLDRYLEALALRPAAWNSLIVTGPLMDPASVRALKRRVYALGLAPLVEVRRFSDRLQHLFGEADTVVSMAGYNSCAEIMQARVPVVLVPRQHPRQEQLIRARRLEELGVARCRLATDPAEALRADIEHSLALRRPAAEPPPLNGLERVSAMVEGLLARRTPVPRPQPELRAAAAD